MSKAATVRQVTATRPVPRSKDVGKADVFLRWCLRWEYLVSTNWWTMCMLQLSFHWGSIWICLGDLPSNGNFLQGQLKITIHHEFLWFLRFVSGIPYLSDFLPRSAFWIRTSSFHPLDLMMECQAWHRWTRFCLFEAAGGFEHVSCPDISNMASWVFSPINGRLNGEISELRELPSI